MTKLNVTVSILVVQLSSITATINEDFVADSFEVMVLPRDTVTISFNITDDDIGEANETFAVMIIGLDVGEGITDITVTIIDNDGKFTHGLLYQ